MSCKNCDEAQLIDENKPELVQYTYTYVRVGKANVLISGCNEHLKELLSKLRDSHPPTSPIQSIEEILDKYAPTDSMDSSMIDPMYEALLPKLKQALLEYFESLVWAEPCEPDCSAVRHAYHQGQWDMQERIRERIRSQYDR